MPFLSGTANNKVRRHLLMLSAKFRLALIALLLAVSALTPLPVFAVPDEIRVMTDDLTDAGDFSLGLHAASVRARNGATTRHVEQGLIELSYGASETIELSVQLPVSKEPGWHANGANLELQYIAPHDRLAGLYWGARIELGRARAPLESEVTRSLEFRPIVGYRAGGWHAVLNTAWRAPLSGADHALSFEPSAKLARQVAPQTHLGVEYYVQSAQRANGADAGLARRKLALLVLDTRVHGIDLSFGVGRGLGPAADGPVVNIFAGFEL